MINVLDRPAFVWVCCLLGPLAVLLLGTDALFAVGFPLDDAWIHAVYGRSLLHEAALTYNPSEPAAGESAPLWALVSAFAQLLSSNPSIFPVITKLLGLVLHGSTCWLLASATAASTRNRVLAGLAALTVGLNPDLLAAAISGMEVPLATFASALAWRATQQARPLPLAITAAVFCWGRPEAMGFFLALPVGFLFFKSPRALQLTLAAVSGTVVGAATLALRTWFATGRPLPSTFYAKAHAGSVTLTHYWAQAWALRGLVGVVLLAALIAAIWRATRSRSLDSSAEGAVLSAAGAVFFIAVCTLITPIDPAAFYHQRYVLPALALALPGVVLLASHGSVKRGALAAGVVLIATVPAVPSRLARLANDAHNIDDVQVAMGRVLAQTNSTDEIWTIDAGAVRFFAAGHVVDLMGLNTPQLLDARASDYLKAHPPRYLALLDAWARYSPLPAHTWTTSTAYTVTSSPAMGHQSLLECPAGDTPRWLTVFARQVQFFCAP